VSGGFEVVGSVTQLIPVRPRRKTIPMTFNYTFTNADAAIGKVTFQVVVNLIGGRDALPADVTLRPTTTSLHREAGHSAWLRAMVTNSWSRALKASTTSGSK
jgi:hypothetical protein